MRDNESGFSLIELLIVIVILGVLAGIVVFSVQGISDRGTSSACKANAKTVQVAQEAYYAKSADGDYADSVGELVTAGLLSSPAPTGVTTSDSGAVVSDPAC